MEATETNVPLTKEGLITETHSTPWQLLEENVSLTKEGLATKP
jgi:hypothetical protein